MRQTPSSPDLNDGPGDEPGPSTANQTVTPDMFHEFLNKGTPGSKLVYHVGYLPLDKPQIGQNEEERTPEQVAVGELARLAMWAGSRGFVELTQKRLRPMVYRYIATVRKG